MILTNALEALSSPGMASISDRRQHHPATTSPAGALDEVMARRGNGQ
jgi:hypothetical protein